MREMGEITLTTDEGFQGWVILELMGRRRLGGYLSEREIGGRGFLRLDVPADPPATQFYGADAVYCITPTTEEMARAVAKLSSVEPVHRWELPAPKQSVDASTEDEPARVSDPEDVGWYSEGEI